MNISLFGAIVGAIGLVFVLIGSGAVIATTEGGMSQSEWQEWARKQSQPRTHFGIALPGRNVGTYDTYSRNIAYVAGQHRRCLFARLGDEGCPLGGYSAGFNYFGLFIAALGAGLFVAARRPQLGIRG